MRQMFLFYLVLTYATVWAQTYSYVPGSEREPNPYLIKCKKESQKSHVCISKIQLLDKNSSKSILTQVICEGTPGKECPTATDCYNQYKKNQELKKIEIFPITGNYQAIPKGQSVPVTKSCDIITKQTLTEKSRVKVKCGELEAYIEKNQPIDEFKFKYFTLTTKDYSLDMNLNAGNVVMALNGAPEIQFSKIRDILKSKGVIFDKSNIASESQLTFSYTPKSKDPMEQLQFYITPTGSNRFSICAGLPNQKCHMLAEPIEVQTPFCDSAILLGVRYCGGQTVGDKVGCFVKKNEVYCVDADKCGLDEYTKEPFMFETPKMIKENKK